tara:strand:+ start:95 stop:883 length:789 start_codon:yes stop_codon:yes gene_type:complete
MNQKEKILKQSLAIRTFPIAKVKAICDSFKIDNHTEVKRFSSNITEWLKPVIDLSDFKYVYPANGITEGINYWYMQEDRKVFRHKDDYVWLPESDSGDIIYMSNPSSAEGNITDIPQDVPVVLDIAHVGSCSKKVRYGKPSKNVEKVFFSMSKCFGLRNYRIGYYWSRKPDEQLERLINSAKYYNYHSMALGEEIIKQVNVYDVNTELKPIQEKLCDELDLIPSDSVWLATTNNKDYDKFKKGDINRISLCELIKEEYDRTI